MILGPVLARVRPGRGGFLRCWRKGRKRVEYQYGPSSFDMVSSRVAKRFQKVNVEISNICNLQCSFCPEVVRAKKIISLELFERIIQQIAPLTEQVCFHLMGDPLVHP